MGTVNSIEYRVVFHPEILSRANAHAGMAMCARALPPSLAQHFDGRRR